MALGTLFTAPAAFGSEKDLLLPDLSTVQFLGLPGNFKSAEAGAVNR